MKHLFYLFVLNLIIFNSFLKCYQSETDPKSGKVFPVSFYIIKDIETSATLPKAIPGTLQFAKGSSIFTVNSKKSMPAKMG